MIPPRGIRNVPDRIRECFLNLTSDRGVDLNLTLEHSLRPSACAMRSVARSLPLRIG